MQVLVITLSYMRGQHTSQHLLANLAGTDTRDYNQKQPLQEMYFNKNLMKYLKNYQMYLVLQMTF